MKTHAFVTFISKEDADRARLELNGVKMTAKYANTKVAKPVRLCKFETRQTLGNLDGRANLLITNISKEVSPHGFYNMFRKFGDIYSCKLMVDYLGNSKGFGYVTYYNVNDADKAKSELHEKDVNGKLIKVIYLEYGRRTEKKKNNVYVKHIPKENFSNSDLEVYFLIINPIIISISLFSQISEELNPQLFLSMEKVNQKDSDLFVSKMVMMRMRQINK